MNLKMDLSTFMIKHKQGLLSRFFLPHYDELSLFTMSYVLVLLVLVNNPPWEWRLQNMKMQADALIIFILLIGFMTGCFLSLFHAFSSRKKTLIEKKLMLLFAVILTGFSGIWGGFYILSETQQYAISVFPIWNIINGFILLSLLRTSEIDENCISDGDVSPKILFYSIGIITFLFSACHFYFDFAWAITLSICTAWATNLNSLAGNLITKEKMKMTG